MNKLKLFSLAFALLISACTTNNGSFNAIATRPMSLYSLTAPSHVVDKDIKSQSSQHVAVIIPFSKAPTITDAINQILNKEKADYLTNVDIQMTTIRLMIWYKYTAWKIEGDAVRIYK